MIEKNRGPGNSVVQGAALLMLLTLAERRIAPVSTRIRARGLTPADL